MGVEVDASMIAEARRRNPDLFWMEADLARLALRRNFDVVVLAGNVPLFCAPTARHDLVAACANHVGVAGAMVSGFQLDRGYHLADYARAATAGGLTLEARWATWDRQPFLGDGAYAVSVHRRVPDAPA